jgi:hypothetical protein
MNPGWYIPMNHRSDAGGFRTVRLPSRLVPGHIHPLLPGRRGCAPVAGRRSVANPFLSLLKHQEPTGDEFRNGGRLDDPSPPIGASISPGQGCFAKTTARTFPPAGTPRFKNKKHVYEYPKRIPQPYPARLQPAHYFPHPSLYNETREPVLYPPPCRRTARRSVPTNRGVHFRGQGCFAETTAWDIPPTEPGVSRTRNITTNIPVVMEHAA